MSDVSGDGFYPMTTEYAGVHITKYWDPVTRSGLQFKMWDGTDRSAAQDGIVRIYNRQDVEYWRSVCLECGYVSEPYQRWATPWGLLKLHRAGAKHAETVERLEAKAYVESMTHRAKS